MSQRPVHIIGVPLDLGQGRRGVDMGPSALRIAGLDQRLAALGHPVTDRGDLHVPSPETRTPGDPAKKYIREIARVCQRLHHAVLGSLRDGALPIVLGGDHSLSLGSVRGAAKSRKVGLIWIDAHADFNTDQTTPSGNIHGMPLSALCGWGDRRLTRLWEEAPMAVDPRRVAVIGARDLDPGEKANLREAGVMVMGMEQIDRLGMTAAVERAIERVSQDVDGLYL